MCIFVAKYHSFMSRYISIFSISKYNYILLTEKYFQSWTFELINIFFDEIIYTCARECLFNLQNCIYTSDPSGFVMSYRVLSLHKRKLKRCLRGILVHLRDCDHIERVWTLFVLLTSHSDSVTLRMVCRLLTPNYGYHYCSFTRMDLELNNPSRLIYH